MAIAATGNEDEKCTTAGKYVSQKLNKMCKDQQIFAESLIQQVLSKGLRNKLTDTMDLVDRGRCTSNRN